MKFHFVLIDKHNNIWQAWMSNKSDQKKYLNYTEVPFSDKTTLDRVLAWCAEMLERRRSKGYDE